MHILSMFLYSKLAFGSESELKKKIPTRFPKINESFFPTLTCGVFVFSSVPAPPRPPPAASPPTSHSLTLTHSHTLTLTHTHSLTHSHTHTHSHSLTLTTLTHSLTLTHSHSLTHTLTLTHTHSLTHSHIHTFNHSLTHTHPSHSLTHSLTHTLTHTLTFTHSHSLTHSLTRIPLLRGRRGTTCTAKGSDVRPGVPPVSLGLRRFCVAGVAQRALPRGRMYALASLRCPLVSAAFAWQAWHNVHCQGVGCTPWRPSGVPWSPPFLRGRRGTTCTAKGSDVRPGVPPVSLGLRRFCVALPRGRMYALASLRCPLVSAAFAIFCVAGVAQRALPRGRMYALASLRCPLVSAAFAWQAWDNVHCQGVGCTPWRPSGVPWSPPLLRGRRGTTCTAKGSDVRPGVRCPLVSAAFAWQAWHNVHCQGVGCTPWRPSGVPWSPPLLRGRRGTTCTAKYLGGGQVDSSPDSAPLGATTPKQALASGLQLQLREF